MKRFYLLAAIFLFVSLFAFAGKDPANYPLNVHILQQSWSSHNTYRSEFKATGRGNIWEGDSVHAFDFTYDCSFGLRKTARNQPYLGKWKKPQLRLVLLAPQIGKSDKYQECEVQTTVRNGVYIIMRGGGISEISQEAFKARRAKRDAADQRGDEAPVAGSKLSVSSAPESAEIEVDGEFMGNTPSVLELDPGEYNITVRKTGYKAWQKKLRVTAGEVKLNAELEPEAAK